MLADHPHSASKRCVITVSSDGPPTYSAWYDMYSAATAADAMCVRQGRAGFVTALGTSENDRYAGSLNLRFPRLGDASNLVVSIKAGESKPDVAATV